MKKKNWLIVAAALSIHLVACGKLSEIEGKLAKNSRPTVLEGKWSACIPTTFGTSYSKVSTYSGNSFSIVERDFTDQNCRDEVGNVMTTAGLFELAGPLESNALMTKINYQVSGTNEKVYTIFMIYQNVLLTGQMNTQFNATSDATRPRAVGIPGQVRQ
jgi:hypothetical protein